MSIALAYIYPILFSLLFGYYNGWQWTDEQDGVYDPKKAKPKWKGASWLMRGLCILTPALVHFTGLDVYHFAIGVALSLPLFDITINMTRGMPLFYLGTTSKTDKLGRWKWIGYAAIIAATITITVLT